MTRNGFLALSLVYSGPTRQFVGGGGIGQWWEKLGQNSAKCYRWTPCRRGMCIGRQKIANVLIFFRGGRVVQPAEIVRRPVKEMVSVGVSCGAAEFCVLDLPDNFGPMHVQCPKTHL